jgi:hypothetical protein
MSVFMAWLGRSRLRRRPASEARRLVHTLGTRIVGLLVFSFFAGITVLSTIFFRNQTTSWWTTIIFVAFSLLGLYLLATTFVEKYEASERGLSGRNAVGTAKQILWLELSRVSYSRRMKWFRLETQTRTVMRISAGLMGLPEFASLLLQYAPAGTIDAEALEVLRSTAGGDLPRL